MVMKKTQFDYRFHYVPNCGEIIATLGVSVLKIILCYVLVTYFVIQTSKASAPKKHVYFQIDEFIKQLMTSEKFDELAEVIADKAAQKIRNIENNNTNAYEKESLRQGDKNIKKDSSFEEKSNHDDKKRNGIESKSTEIANQSHEKMKEKEARADTKSNKDQDTMKGKNSSSEEKLNHKHESNKKKDSESEEKSNPDRDKTESHSQKRDKNQKPAKFGKIDTLSFLKDHMTSKELELNYKHLTEELGKHRYNVKDNNPKTQKEYDKDKHGKYNENIRAVDKLEKESEKGYNLHAKNGHSKEVATDSKEFKLSDHSSNENEAHEQANFHDVDERTHSSSNKSTKYHSKTANEESKHNKFKFNTKNSEEKPIPRVEGQDSDKSDNIPKLIGNYDDTKTLEDFKKISQELNSPLSSSKEIVEVRMNRANNEETSPSNENLSVPMLDSNTNQIKQARTVRKENGKYFTLDTSLEYAEYHENVAKQTSQKYINL